MSSMDESHIRECVPVELDRRSTELGELILRRRRIQSLDFALAHEVLLDGEFLMSSVVNASEVALARLALETMRGKARRVLVGGLGLGCTADAALQEACVRRLDVIELLEPVLEWHRSGLVPLGASLTRDPRVRLLQGDFFSWVFGEAGSAPGADATYDAILLDIDHSSEFLLSPRNVRFYSEDGLRALSDRLEEGGVFAFWSSDPGEQDLAGMLRRVFPVVTEHEVEFFHPAVEEDVTNSILVASKRSA